MRANFSWVILGIGALGLVGCLPPAVQQTPAPTVVGEMELPPVRLEPGVVKIDGKPAVKVGAVVATIVARRYSSGSIYYEVKSLKPEKEGAFEIVQTRVESAVKYPEETARENGTQKHEAQRRTLTENDLIQLHVTLEVERTDAAGVEHPPKLYARVMTELWGRVTVFVAEQNLVTGDGPARWSAAEERVESQKREDKTAESAEVAVPAGAEWVPVDKSTILPGQVFPMRRAIGHGSFVMKRE